MHFLCTMAVIIACNVYIWTRVVCAPSFDVTLKAFRTQIMTADVISHPFISILSLNVVFSPWTLHRWAWGGCESASIKVEVDNLLNHSLAHYMRKLMITIYWEMDDNSLQSTCIVISRCWQFLTIIKTFKNLLWSFSASTKINITKRLTTMSNRVRSRTEIREKRIKNVLRIFVVGWQEVWMHEDFSKDFWL